MAPFTAQPPRPLPIWTVPFVAAALVVVIVCAAAMCVGRAVVAVIEAF